MASEIRITLNLAAAKGNAAVSRTRSFNADWATARSDSQVQSIGSGAHEAFGINADITTPATLYLTNLDPTNYIEYGVDTTGTFRPFGKLKPGESALLRLAASVVPYAKANTAACDMEWIVLND